MIMYLGAPMWIQQITFEEINFNFREGISSDDISPLLRCNKAESQSERYFACFSVAVEPVQIVDQLWSYLIWGTSSF